MKIRFINNVQNYNQLTEITRTLEDEETSDGTFPREDYEKESHQVVIDYQGLYGRYQFTLYFDKHNETLEKVAILVI